MEKDTVAAIEAPNDSSSSLVSTGKARRVFESLKQDILEGKIGPNERLVERDLVQRFGVSKTPVKEALNRLKYEGLVRGRYYRGMAVIPVSLTVLRDLYELREALEGIAARSAAVHCDAAFVEALEENIKAQEAAMDNRDFYRLNGDFHSLIASRCNNVELRSILSALYSRHRLLTAASPLLNSVRSQDAWVLNEHRAIVRAISTGDSAEAERVAREHARNSFARIIGQSIDDVEAARSSQGSPVMETDKSTE
ncbi:GntR family transcriptional regulator [Chloroflexota bacterium]